ncbi:MAG: prepilin peptidase [Candidatus Cloacimonetes bacterium]|nr:prepilin peptidase [Candidatus Cloacimonadota bacterium]
MIPLEIYYILLAVFGAVLGSFFNVCIFRIPRKESIANIPSHCPKCNHKITPIQNIPIFSYIFLKGRCKQCKARIPIRYLIVEVLAILLFVFIFRFYNNSLNIVYAKYLTLFSFGLIIFFIDIEHKIIPDSLSFPLILLGVGFSLFKSVDVHFMQSLIGTGSGFFLFLLIAYFCSKSLKKDCLGGGDIKLIAALGSFLGLYGILISIFFASVLAICTLIVIRHDLKKEFPFGPFLILGTLMYTFLGETLIRLYLSLWNL